MGKSISLPIAHTTIVQVIDPVCGMSINPATAAAEYEYKGSKYYFCAARCKERFAADPDSFLSKPATSDGSSDAHAHHGHATATLESQSKIQNPKSEIEFTCPMHPEIVQIRPGSCPICGMALEPKEITLDDARDPEYLDMKRRFWISVPLTIPVFILAMAEMFVDFNSLVP